MRNLFLRAHELRHGSEDNPLGTGWEDTLTEAMAFLLSSDVQTLAAWTRLVMGRDAGPVAEIQTQYASGGDRPDLAFHFESGHLLLVENKAGAALQDRQLERYLALRGRDGKPTSVAFMALKERSLPREVLGHPGYRAPTGRSHLLWQDFYGCIRPEGGGLGLPRLRRFMCEYLGQLGLAPSSLVGEWPRLFELSTIVENQRVQKEFGRQLGLVRAELKAMGLVVSGASHYGLFGALTGTTALRHLSVDPGRPRRERLASEALDQVHNEVFRIALIWNSDADEATAWRLFERSDRPFITPAGQAWWPAEPHRMSQNRIRVEYVTNLQPLVVEETGISARLGQAGVPLLRWLAREVPDLGPP